MAKSPEAYVDTSAFIALVDRSDSHHTLFKRLFADPPPLVTTTLVVAEGHGWFLRRYDQGRALQFLAMIEQMRPLTVLPVGPNELRAATGIIRKYADQKLTIADAVGLYLLAKRRTKSCWSTDFHLGLSGVRLAIHS
jgi:predicted nucleic acid-binding protein